MRLGLVSMAVAALGLLAGCGAANVTRVTSTVPDPTIPPCAPVTERVSLPTELVGLLPLPPGTVLTSSRVAGPGPLVIGGYVPGTLKQAAAFFPPELQKAGFQLGQGDAELDEAEQTFSGHGLQGRWKVHSILACSDAVSLTIAISKTP